MAVTAKTKRTKKEKTPKQSLMDLCKSFDEVEAVFFIERVHSIKDMTLRSIKENPEGWEASFVHPNVYERLFNKVSQFLKED